MNKEKLRQRFLSDPLPVRLGGLSATLGRISSSARTSSSHEVVADLLDEAKHLIEWTAADAEPETAAELVQIQLLIVLWAKGMGNRHQRQNHTEFAFDISKNLVRQSIGIFGLVVGSRSLAYL